MLFSDLTFLFSLKLIALHWFTPKTNEGRFMLNLFPVESLLPGKRFKLGGIDLSDCKWNGHTSSFQPSTSWSPVMVVNPQVTIWEFLPVGKSDNKAKSTMVIFWVNGVTTVSMEIDLYCLYWSSFNEHLLKCGFGKGDMWSLIRSVQPCHLWPQPTFWLKLPISFIIPKF